MSKRVRSPELGDDGQRDKPLHAAQHACRPATTGAGATRQRIAQLRFEPRDALGLFVDRAQLFLKRDLLRRGRTTLARNRLCAAFQSPRPTWASVAEQERLQAAASRLSS